MRSIQMSIFSTFIIIKDVRWEEGEETWLDKIREDLKEYIMIEEIVDNSKCVAQ